jgi:GT2 family glycosyltransferase
MSPNQPLVSIVIPNYNGSRFLAPLFGALERQTALVFETIVVDNGSSDGSRAYLESAAQASPFPLRTIFNERNLGFAAAINQGARAGTAPWIFTLNNDTVPEPGCVEALLECAGGPRAGMVGAKMLFAHDRGQINTAGIAIDWAGIAWDWRGGERDTPDETECTEIFGPSGGAALYARELWEAMGGFDEAYFAYLEDVDLAWRARMAGWNAYLQPRARVYHEHSATLGDESPAKLRLLGRNKVRLVVKNYPASYALRWPVVFAYDVMAVLYATVRGRQTASLRGRLDACREIRSLLTARRRAQAPATDVANWARMIRPLRTPWNVAGRFGHLRGRGRAGSRQR